MPKTYGVSAHAAGVGGDADPSRLHVSPSQNAEPLDEWRERMAAKAAEQAALRQRTRAAANAPAAVAHPPLETAAAKRARRDRDIVKAYTSDPTATLASIAAEFDLGHERVSEILAAAGVQVRRGRRPKRPAAPAPPTPTPPPAVAAPRDAEPVEPVEPVAEARPAPWHALAPEEKTGPALSAFRRDRVQRVADAIAAYLAGETVDALAVRFHLQKAYLRQQMREAGVTLRDDRRTGSGGMNAKTAADDDPTVAAAIVDAYAAGKPITTIAATIPGARSAKYVTNVLRRHGVTLRPSVTGGHSDAVAKGVRNEQIVAAWHATPRPTHHELATQFHLTPARISQILRAAEPQRPVPAEQPTPPESPLAVFRASLPEPAPAEPAPVTAVRIGDTVIPVTPAPGHPLEAAPCDIGAKPIPSDVTATDAVRAARRVVTSLLDVAVALAGLARDAAALEIAARDVLTRLEDTTEGVPS